MQGGLPPCDQPGRVLPGAGEEGPCGGGRLTAGRRVCPWVSDAVSSPPLNQQNFLGVRIMYKCPFECPKGKWICCRICDERGSFNEDGVWVGCLGCGGLIPCD